MAARLLALLAAVAMVAGALVVRDRMDDDEERSSTSIRLACSTELAAVCEALAADPGSDVRATVEEAAATAERLTALGPGEDGDLDGWLVAGPWPAIVDDARRRVANDPVLDGDTDVLARSPIVLAVWPDRDAVLKPHCGGTVGWKCLGENAGAEWTSLVGGEKVAGRVKPGHPPLSTAAGVAVLGAATVGFFGRTDLSSAELDEDDFRDWLDRLERAVPERPPSPLETMLTRPSAFDAVGTLEAEAAPLLARTEREPKPALLYPEPVATADVVLGTTGGRAAELLRDLIAGPTGRKALAAAGWRVPGEATAPGIDATRPLPPASGLPGPGVLEALRRQAERIR